MKATLLLTVLGTIAIKTFAVDSPIGRLPDGTSYLMDEVDFALKPEIARHLSPVGGRRREVDRGPLLKLHASIAEVIGRNTASERWLKGEAMPARLFKRGTNEVPPSARALKAKLKHGVDALEVVTELSRHPDVAWASLNVLYTISATPNDLDWGKQWGPMHIRADEAWEVTPASPSIRIAIIDSGVDLSHYDLSSRIIYDRGFAGNPDGGSVSDHRDDSTANHGTHVAGIAAAIRNNTYGVAGIAEARIMAMGCAKWDSSDGVYKLADAADAIRDAVDNGADVINCSWGKRNFSSVWILKSGLLDALDYAQEEGVVVVAAAGNDTNNIALSDSKGWTEHDWPLVVSNINSNNNLAFDSNYGSRIDLAAPGSAIWSTVRMNDGLYGQMSGTSMSAPHVSGAAAMVKAMNPSLVGATAVKDLLFRMAKDLGAAGKDNSFGYGLVQLDPVFLKTIKAATAFVGLNPAFIETGTYELPYMDLADAVDAVSSGSTLVLNGGVLGLNDYEYPALTITKKVTLTALPDRPAVIGK